VDAVIDWVSVALMIVALGWIVLIVLALRQIFTSPGLSDTNRLLWVLIVLLAPVVGTLVWFFVGRNRTGSLGRG
jgi:Phospholipase_D-nuclease N-terminal